MKKIELISKKNNHFIGCWQMENQEIMDEIIDFFEIVFLEANWA